MPSHSGPSGLCDMAVPTFEAQCDNTCEDNHRRVVGWLEYGMDDSIRQCCANAQEVGL